MHGDADVCLNDADGRCVLDPQAAIEDIYIGGYPDTIGNSLHMPSQ
jgi:hypothetical protein